MGAGAGSLGIARTPRGVQLASGMYDSAPAFSISPEKGIPGKGSISQVNRTRERITDLMHMPRHKSGTSKFDGDPMKRTIAPLTGEDTTNFINMNLMSTLRQGRSMTGKAQEGRESAQMQIDNAPSFYDDDMKKWKDKFNKAIQNRTQFKKSYMSGENKSILATNSNFF